MLRHPWSPPLLGRPLLGPDVLARTEFLQSTLAGAGLRGHDLTAATHGIADRDWDAVFNRALDCFLAGLA